MISKLIQEPLNFFKINGWNIELEKRNSFCKLSSIQSGTRIEVCFFSRLPYFEFEDNPNNKEKKLDIESDDELEKGVEEEEEKEIKTEDFFGKTQFEMNFGIYMLKQEKRTLFAECSIKESNFTVDRCYFLPSGMSMLEHQTLFKQDRLFNLHGSYAFESLEEEIRIGILELLILFGFDEQFVLNIQKLSVNRENELYSQWLKDFEQFLAPV